ncbi:4'-phosphopantetheinyl transferase [Dokdonia sp. Dokd-P16]|uniref:4'-phosphopantetheinyl transferase family protein n=1 Tax=Dokdonia sp. Dokd-P16 TaxID=2173169 RepID=UPI000D5479BE|nr:4'-phosphopantetheinyl transferase superfamily protein [Dokdonia sp. Dokd-P16]AWH75727.1 4'-phosphopantetheinyl transferase [Dokdonia sp. Dokd-P16]
MGEIWIVNFSNNSQQFTDEELLKKLPESTVNRALRYLNKESFLSFITGRLLLKRAILESEYSSFSIEDIKYSDKGKPSFTNVNFSISHSNGYVVLIFGTVFQVGIDIEKRKDIDLKLFKYLFTDLEWKVIMQDNSPIDRFYWYWVRKEALLKTVDCSLKELEGLEIFEDYGIYKDQRYYFKTFEFNPEFNGVLAIEEEMDVNVKFIELETLLK